MTKRSFRLLLVVFALLILTVLIRGLDFLGTTNLIPFFTSPTRISLTPASQSSSNVSSPQEQPITIIPLSGPAAESKSEISGMAWYEDTLIILPQYPSRFGTGDGAVFSLEKDEILAFLNGVSPGPLHPMEILFSAPGIEKIDGFEGFEAIAISGNQVYLTIEAKPHKMMGYVISGIIGHDLSGLYLDPDTLIENPPQVQIDNMTDESILITPGSVLTFFEANGVKINPSPVVHSFTFSGIYQSTLPMVNIEYRLTDVTTLDDHNRFWGINYFYPGDTKLTPDVDPLVEQFGAGPTHALNTNVERLVQFQYSKLGITLTAIPPIQLQLLPDNDARNWEALAYLDKRGFLLASDKFPETILAFVSFP